MCTDTIPYRKLETDIPRNGIARGQSQFPHSCVCERLMYSQVRLAYSAAGKYVGINRSQTLNMEIGTETAQFLFWEDMNGIFVAVWFET